MDDITKAKPLKDEEKEEEEEEDDAPSLSDFPLNSYEPEKNHSSYKTQEKRRSSSEPSDFFEFFNDFTAKMSHAEDIIFRGKLVPYRNQHQILKSLSADDATSFPRRNNLRSSIRSNSLTSTRPPQNRRSMDGKTLRRRSFSKSSARSEGSNVSKCKWFVLLFGPLKLQPEMDLRDMKSRQVRRSPGNMFPSMDAGGSSLRNFWGFDLLRVLSCKSHASVAVTASVGLAPRFQRGEKVMLT